MTTSAEACAELDKVQARLNASVFKVLVVGEFSNGKSTFLNALIPGLRLPTATSETTAVITVIRHGEKSKATITYWGEHDEHGNEISAGRKEEIPFDKLDTINALSDSSSQTAEKIELLEVEFPSKYCEKGVELVDTPGLNTTLAYHEKATLDYLHQGHTGILLLNARQFLTASESKYIDKFRKHMNKFFFIMNRIDEVNDDPDNPLQEHIDYCRTKLEKALSLSGITLYPLNSKLAHTGDEVKSGMSRFVDDFERFLASSEKSREMVEPAIAAGLTSLRAQKGNAEMMMGALTFSPQEFEQKINTIRPYQEILRSKKRDLAKFAEDQIGLMSSRYERMAEELLRSRINTIKNDISAMPGDPEVLKDSLRDYIGTELLGPTTEIQEYVDSQFCQLREELIRRTEDILYSVEHVKSLLSSKELANNAHSLSIQSAYNTDGVVSSGDLALTIGGSAGIGFAATFLLGPVGWVLGTVGGTLWAYLREEKVRQKKFKQLADQVYQTLNRSVDQWISEGSREIGKETRALSTQLQQHLDLALRTLDEKIQMILREMKESESRIQSARHIELQFVQTLDALESDFVSLNTRF